MLQAHMNAIEENLISISKIPANSGHTLHKGTPRETFIKEYLESHLSSNVAIGSGEIIDSNSKPGESRNQYDIVIYKKNFPKLDFGGGIKGFLIESVIATIEVKSVLDQAAIDQSVKAAYNAKNLSPNLNRVFTTGWNPPKILNYVVAYTGPAKMKTAYNWIINSHESNNIPLPSWDKNNKFRIPGTALDGIFLLGGGFVMLDNTPLSINGSNLPGTHVVVDSEKGNILMFFLTLQTAFSNMEASWLNPKPYVLEAKFPGIIY